MNRRLLLACAALPLMAQTTPPANVQMRNGQPRAVTPAALVDADGNQVGTTANPLVTSTGTGSTASPTVTRSQGSPSLTTSQISVATTATLVVAARTGRSRLIVTQSAAGPCYYGPTLSVSASTGARLTVTGASKAYAYTGALYALCPGGAVTVDVDEEY